MNKNPVHIVFFIICFIITSIIVLTDPGSSRAEAALTDEQAAAAALFGSPSSASRRENIDGSNSFFEDSGFMNTGIGDGSVDEEKTDSVVNKNTAEPDILEPVNPNNPKNPQTGTPYSDSAMKKFAVLRKKFPDNELIPHQKSQAEKSAAAKKKNRMLALSSLVIMNNANEDEVNEYYDLQKKSYQDRKELLGYVFESMADKMSDDIKKQYEKVRNLNDKQLKELEDKRKASLGSIK